MSGYEWRSFGSTLDEQFTREAIRNRPRSLKTGFSRLDRLLGGGLKAGLTVLGGGTGLGKSTFALQLAEQVSQSADGAPVLYFSLEMSAEWIAAKAVSRRYFKAAASGGREGAVSRQCGVTASDLLSAEAAERRPEDEWRKILAIRESLRQNGNFYLIEKALTAVDIVRVVKKFMEERAQSGDRRPPLVIVDYLQILLPEDTKAINGKQLVEDSLSSMFELSQHQIPIMLISSLNRNSYGRPMQSDAFKETGSIEYYADVLLGLQYCACHKNEWSVEKEQKKFPRDVEIVILKQRYGGCGEIVPFRYYAEFDCFEEAGSGDAPGLEQPQPTPQESRAEAVPAGAADGAPVKQRAAGGIQSQPFYSNNTKIANEIRKGAPAGRRISCQVFADTATEFEISQQLSCFDCNTADAIYTLYKNGRDSFTPGLVLKALSGDPKQTITAQKRKEITDSIEKLRAVRIWIDCTAEMRTRGQAGEEEEKIFSGAFLSVRKSGKEKYHFEGTDAMPLYSYGELATQMICFPSRLLAVYEGDKKITDTMENINIKRFLIRRLEVVRYHDPGKSASAGTGATRRNMRNISFRESGGMFSEMGICRGDYQSASAWKHKCRTVYRTVIRILDYYQRIGYIAGYQEKTAGGIELPDQVANPWELN